jgi:hypothetical protein
MLEIRDEQELARVLRSELNPDAKQLLQKRWSQVTKDLSPTEIADVVKFVIVEPGETATDLEQAIGFSVFAGGDDGFSPEWAECHEGVAVELCWVWSDDGGGAIAIVPFAKGMDADLLNACRALAALAPAQA